jgi:DNA-directed RNA polymerase specialized sigma24 family protein
VRTISDVKREVIIKRWSDIYKRVVGDLFSLEELRQEAWLALLEAEDSSTYEKSGKASEETYLNACVKHRLGKYIFNEYKHQHCIPINEDEHAVELVCGSPEEIVLAQCLLDSLKDTVEVSKAFNYRKDTLEKRSAKAIIDLLLSGKSYPEISKLLKVSGIEMEARNIHLVVKKLRQELAKILKNS